VIHAQSAPTTTVRNPITLRRVLVGLLLAAVGLSCVVLPWTFYLLILVLALACLYELNHLCEIKGQPLVYPVAILGVVGYTVLAVLGNLHKWEGVLLAGVVVGAFWMGMYGEHQGYFGRTAYTLLTVLYIGKLLTYFIFIRQVPGTGLIWTYYAIFIVALTDIFGMFIGTAIGRHQLTRISPKKTIEGSIGAVVVVVALAVLATRIPQLHLLWWQGAVIAVLTCIAAQVGDLVESALKRDVGVKDTGSVIQGHGGVLDRFDSYLFGGTVFFASLHLLGILPIQ
jgi:phosphatidate cytidylyltransferase